MVCKQLYADYFELLDCSNLYSDNEYCLIFINLKYLLKIVAVSFVIIKGTVQESCTITEEYKLSYTHLPEFSAFFIQCN